MNCKIKIFIVENMSLQSLQNELGLMSWPNSILDHYCAHINSNGVGEGILCFCFRTDFGGVLPC